MNTDIRVSVSFRGHRKRKKLQRLLGAEAVLCLIDLWIVAAMSRPDGVLAGMDAEDIALDAGWDGDPQEFVDALVAVGFLDVIGEGVYALHDWDDHNSYASSVDDRSDKARFSRLRQAYPELHEKLYASGARAISREEYQSAVGNYLAGHGEQLNSSAATSGDATATPRRTNGDANESPGAALAPSPSPSPSPSQKNTLCEAAEQSEQSGSAPSGAARTRSGGAFDKQVGVKAFARFWEAFGDKRGKQPAWLAWKRIKGMSAELAEQIIAAAARYAEQRPAILDRGGTPKMAQGWLTDRRWEDEAMEPVVDGVMNPSLRKAFENVLGESYEHVAA